MDETKMCEKLSWFVGKGNLKLAVFLYLYEHQQKRHKILSKLFIRLHVKESKIDRQGLGGHSVMEGDV